MRIGYVIGSLARAGAELQLMRLAEGMRERGHHVHLLAYDRASPLDDDLRRIGVEVTVGGARSRPEKIRVVRRWLASGRYGVVHAMLNHVASLTLIARFPSRRPAIVATDFSAATYAGHRPGARVALLLYALADRVVTETASNDDNLRRVAPWLRGKTQVIRNGLALARFVPATTAPREPGATFVFCVVGTVYPVKNPLRIIDAAAELRQRGHDAFRIEWYGRLGLEDGDADGQRAIAYARERDVAEHVRFLGEVSDVERAYRRAHALLHASLREGFPNAVAEAMACGLPLVVSRVSDLPRVIDEGTNGFVVDETDAMAIADGLERMLRTPAEERTAMGQRSRALAERWFAMDRYLDEFEHLYRTIGKNGA